jgi:hypothetical protein
MWPSSGSVAKILELTRNEGPAVMVGLDRVREGERERGGLPRGDRAHSAGGSDDVENSRGSAVVMPWTPRPLSDWIAARSLTVQA